VWNFSRFRSQEGKLGLNLCTGHQILITWGASGRLSVAINANPPTRLFF
jgi:hypothetical protein